MKRSGLRSDPEKTRAWQQRSRKRLPFKSAKRKVEDVQRARVIEAVFQRDGHTCYAEQHGIFPGIECGSPFLNRPPFEVHELILRSSWRGGALVLDNCVPLCQTHHDYATDHPDEAVAVGLEVRAHLPWLNRSTTEGATDGS